MCSYMCALTHKHKEVECDPGGICMSPDLHHHNSLCPPALAKKVFHNSVPAPLPAEYGDGETGKRALEAVYISLWTCRGRQNRALIYKNRFILELYLEFISNGALRFNFIRR